MNSLKTVSIKVVEFPTILLGNKAKTDRQTLAPKATPLKSADLRSDGESITIK